MCFIIHIMSCENLYSDIKIEIDKKEEIEFIWRGKEMKQKFKMSGGILICIILVTLLMGNTTVFAETRTLPEEYYDLPSVKVFGMYNGEGVTDFICFTETYGGSKIRAEKQVGQNYAVVYYEKGQKEKFIYLLLVMSILHLQKFQLILAKEK